MARTPDKWFAMRTDFFGSDSYQLGMYNLSPPALALYMASIAYVCRWGVDDAHRNVAAYVGIKRAKPYIDELVDSEFWLASPHRHSYYVLHEGTLWRRGDGVRRRAMPTETRKRVMQRDNFACVECGSHHALSIDHIWPYSKGGTDELTNLRVLCRSCNSRKGDRV